MGIIGKIWSKVGLRNPLVIKQTKKKIMKGETPFGSPSVDNIHAFWQNEEKLAESKNDPQGYVFAIERSEYLLDIINSQKIDNKNKILEIGCNVGRNLNFLYENNFKNLTGIEINSKAIEILKKTFPELASSSRLLIGPVEEKIKEIEDKSIFLTYTMAVLEHIHPSSNFIFGEISRVTSDYIITIEIEDAYFSRMYPRDYGKIFTELGWKMLHSEKASEKSGMSKENYILRIFSK